MLRSNRKSLRHYVVSAEEEEEEERLQWEGFAEKKVLSWNERESG